MGYISGHAYTVPEVTALGTVIIAVDANTDAIILAADLAAFLPLPGGVMIATTFESDGTTPLRCVNGVRVATYPPGNFEDTHNFISDFNCGLSLIARNGTYAQICAMYAPDSSVAPYCLNPSEIETPTRACKKLRK